MYGSADYAVRQLVDATASRHRAERALHSAIREALAGNVPIDQIASRGHTTIDHVQAVADELHAQTTEVQT